MSILKWKFVGGFLPFVLITTVVEGLRESYPITSVLLIGATVIFANAVGYVEGKKREI